MSIVNKTNFKGFVDAEKCRLTNEVISEMNKAKVKKEKIFYIKG